jgi:hypothetical protein
MSANAEYGKNHILRFLFIIFFSYKIFFKIVFKTEKLIIYLDTSTEELYY